jgi:hypothetical protein
MTKKMRHTNWSKSDHFINEELLSTEPLKFDQVFNQSRRRTIGKLGNGILRPGKSKLPKEEKFDNSLHSGSAFLRPTKKNELDQLSGKIATSIQNRIDKATLEKREQAKAEKPTSKKSHIVTVTIILSGLIASGILIYVFRRSAPSKPKTVKP